MTAREKAEWLAWDVDAKPKEKRNQTGIALQEEYRRMNADAAKAHARWLALADDLRLKR